jgi:hypothetical protein
MADEIIGYRVTRAGDAVAYRITTTGLMRIVYLTDEAPPPVPDWLIPILRVRGMIYDPMAKDIIFVEALPYFNTPEGVAFTLGDGNYQVKNSDGDWVNLPTKFTDAAIEDMVSLGGSALGGACLLIDRLIARIQPDDYITSGTAGGQSVGFPSLESMLAFYRGLKADLKAEDEAAAGFSTGRLFTVERPAVGGVIE